ncbi:aldolase [Macrophomina phaseolina]|uniref:Aldolase n=1 Tax=Macrophomina phaseolina TaxID=35725 RepID=A0ABQ8FVN8_9PEZI|nr:aldolase [Macrophomina phaseolina]
MSTNPLEAMSHGPLALAGIPTFSSLECKRRWQLEHMAGAFRVFARHGYTEGMSGHISVRDPIIPNAFWINPLGIHYGLLRASDMILLDMGTGKVLIEGRSGRPANATGFLIHRAVHEARPDVHAVCHTHSPHGRAWSAFARPLEMLNQDICNVFGAQAVYAEYGGLALDGREGERIAQALENAKVCMLTNHGMLTVGGTVDESAYLFRLMEASCHVQLLAEAAAANGLVKKIISDEEAAYNFKMASEPNNLYREFQPDYELELRLSGGDFCL